MIPAGLDLSIERPEDIFRMREQYEYATLQTHMMVAGVLYLRCGMCRTGAVPHNWHFTCWCEWCLDNPERARALKRERLAASAGGG